MRTTTRLRQLIERPEILVMPGIYDALGARIAERAGFEAVTCGGFAATATLLGQPDTSQLSLTELADHYARLCDATALPVFADMDTGFGNSTNARRALHAYERAGVAGAFIEDQVFPKRCGHTAGKQVVPSVEMVAKLQAVLDERRDPDFVIMARTDALAIHGLDAAIDRACLYRECGADLVFVEAPRSVDDMQRICTEVDGPCLANSVEHGLTPLLSAADLQAIGYAAVVHPVSALFAVTATLQSLMASLHATGSTQQWLDRIAHFDEFTELVGLKRMRDDEQRLLERAARTEADHRRALRKS